MWPSVFLHFTALRNIGYDLACFQRLLHVDDALIGGTAKLQGNAVQILHKFTVNQHVEQREHFVGVRASGAAVGKQLPVKELAGVTPDILLRIALPDAS